MGHDEAEDLFVILALGLYLVHAQMRAAHQEASRGRSGWSTTGESGWERGVPEGAGELARSSRDY
jgi:hypothetical protein